MRESRFVRNVATVAGGAVGAQVIAAAFAPLLTRQYGPEAYGVLGAFLAITGMLTHIAGLAYPIAIVLPEDDQKARNIAALSMGLVGLLALLLAIVAVVLGDSAAAWLDMPGQAGLAMLLPVAVILITVLSISKQWLIRHGLFHITAVAGVIQAIAKHGSMALVGLFAPSAAVMLLATALSPLVFVAVAARGLGGLWAPSPSPAPARRLPSVNQLREVAHEYRDFPLYRAPQLLVNSLGFALPTLLLATMFGTSAAGFYALTQMVMGLPSTLIGRAVGDVFYPRITETVRRGRSAHKEIRKATIALLLTGLIPFGTIMLAGPQIFGLVFGEEWQQAGHYARWLAPFFLLNLANKPVNAAVPALGLQKALLGYELLSTGLKASLFVAGFYFLGGEIASVALFAAAGTVTYAALIVFVIHRAKIRPSRLFNESRKD